MIPELAHLWKRWDETHAALIDCLLQFPDDRFNWRPAPHATTAGQIVGHIAGAEGRYAQCILGEPLERPEGTARFEIPDRAAAMAIAQLGADQALRAAESVTAEALRRTLADDWSPLGPRVEGPLDALWFFEQMVRHKAYHLGQLWYLSMMLETE